MSKHKCQSKNCKNMVNPEQIWCDKCLEELGELLEVYKGGFVPTGYEQLN